MYAVSVGTFKKINLILPGIQIDVNAQRMMNLQMGLFCLAGALATLVAGYVLLALMKRITIIRSLYLRAVLYYMTLCFLLIDPLYLSVLSSFVGGGDMNGIVRILPEAAVRIAFGMITLINIGLLFWMVIPCYRKAFLERKPKL